MLFEIGFLSTGLASCLYYVGRDWPQYWLALVDVSNHLLGDIMPIAFMLCAHYQTFRIVPQVKSDDDEESGAKQLL